VQTLAICTVSLRTCSHRPFEARWRSADALAQMDFSTAELKALSIKSLSGDGTTGKGS
jgi:hypothetical protein